tara:strand:- start:14754 stop:15554 length:801 start_codon:yes stop_codon:yes gene_type:complete
MANTFKHRRLSYDKRQDIASALANEILGPQPDQSPVIAEIQKILDQVHTMIMADPSREAWFKLPKAYRETMEDEYHSPWKNQPPPFRDLLSGVESDRRISGSLDDYQLGRALDRMDVEIADIDFWYFHTGNSCSQATLQDWMQDTGHIRYITPFIDQARLGSHIPSRAFDGNTIVKNHIGRDALLYNAIAELVTKYMSHDVNLRKLSIKLASEMEDCTTKQIIEAWPQAEQIIYDAYDFNPNVSKPTAPLSQVIADAGILQITAQS